MRNLPRTAFFDGAASVFEQVGLSKQAAFELTKQALTIDIPDWAAATGLGLAGLGGGMAAGYGLHSLMNRNKDTEQPQAMAQVHADALRKQMLPQMGHEPYPPAEDLFSLYADGGQNVYELPSYAYYF